MFNWLKKVFSKKDNFRHNRNKSVFDFLVHYREAERQWFDMIKYSYEVWRGKHLCDKIPLPSKKIMQRYNLSPWESATFAWYLLEQYELGNIIIKENVKTQQGNEGATGGNTKAFYGMAFFSEYGGKRNT